MAKPSFQFSLRTLFIVVTLLAIPCGYVGYQAKLVRERKAMIEQIREGKGLVVPVDVKTWPKMPTPSWIRRVLGDEPVYSIGIEQSSKPSNDEIRELFPEAAVYHFDPPPPREGDFDFYQNKRNP